MKQAILFLCLILTGSVRPAYGEIFRFRHSEGDQYRILSQVNQEVYINNRFSHKADLLYKISVRIDEVKEDGSGLLNSTFQISTRAYGSEQAYQQDQEYPSRLWRSAQGIYSIQPSYYMPVVRNVPTFPDRDISAGYVWQAPAEEVQDFRELGINEPFRIPTQATYKYEGKTEKEGRNLDLFSIQYRVNYDRFRKYPTAAMFPIRVEGYSQQKYFWNNERGEAAFFEEVFDFMFYFNTGDSIRFRGRGSARIVDSEVMDKERVADSIRKEIETRGIENAGVKTGDKGVTIVLENIQFLADSAVLLPSEREKLDKIGAILKSYPDRDILISGHTALAGTEEGRQKLSEERADAVARYFLSQGIRAEDRMTIRGMGAREPVADNRTEEGMKRNRRVEITILEN